MSVKADGTLLIETGVDLEGFETDCRKLQQSAKRAAKSILDIEKNLESVMRQLASSSSEAAASTDEAEHKAKSAQKEARETAKSAKEAAKEAGKAKKELDGIRDKKITITRMEDTSQDEYDGPLYGPEKADPRFMGYSREAMEAIGIGAEEAETSVNELYLEITKTEDALKQMEAAGQWFGDSDYDDAYTKLKILNQEAKEYQERLNLDSSINPFDQESFAGQIRDAELELARLASAGKGLGSKEFDEVYRKLALLKEEAKAYAKELAKTPDQAAKEENLKKLGESAKISRKKIVELNDEISRLKKRQKELEAAGTGLGYQEYDQNIKKLSELERKLKKYEDAVTGAKKKTKNFSDTLNSATSRISRLTGIITRATGALIKGSGNAARAVAGLNRHTENTRMTMGKMLATSVLFSAVFRGISAVTSGIGEGFQNLAMYSDHTNASISALMSAMTRLKNSIATAFDPILSVAAPILVTFINLIARALTYVGMFFAALTGRSSFVKAVGVQQDYRESLSGTAEAANDAADATNKLAGATKKAEKEKDRYLSGLDEIRRWESSDSGDLPETGGNGNYRPPGSVGGINPGDMFETVPIENSIKGLADKIKKLLQEEDWEGLGKFVADGLNKGMKRIYDVISWKKVGPKITKFVRAFTDTFNSLVKYLDFDLMGRTIGAGIDTLIRTFNRLIGPGGIDFKQIGRKLSEGLRGAIGEIGWTELGNLMGNYFMIAWDVLSGFVTDMARKNGAGITGWEELGQSLGDALNGMFARISFTEAGMTLTNGINGIFEMVQKLAETVDWDAMADNVTSGLNAAFQNLNWEEAGQSLNAFLGKLSGFIVDVLEDTDWEEVGRGVGNFLKQVDWGSHLWSMITAIVDAIGDLFDGLEESGTAGKIAAFIGKAFIAVKIADITGIGTLVKKLVSQIGTKLISGESISLVAGKLKSLFSSGTKDAGDLLGDLGKAAGGASGGFSSLASSLGPLVGTAGLIAGATWGIVELTRGIAGLVEGIQGGNGKLSEMGAAINDLAGKMQNIGTISSEQADEINKIVDSCEDAGMSAEEMTNTVMEKFAEWGLSTQNVNAVLQENDYWTTKTKESVDLLAQGAEQLGAGMSKTAGEIDLSSVSMKEAMGGMRDALWELSMTGGEFSGTYQGILMSMDDTLSSATTAQEALDMISGQLEAAGVPADEFIDKLGVYFPQATQAVKTSVDTNIVGAQQTVTSSMKTAGDAVDKESKDMKKAAEENLPGVAGAVETAFSDVDQTTVTKWGSSSAEVKKNLDHMKQTAAKKLAEMTETVRSYSQSMYNVMTKKWESIARRVGQIIAEMNSKQINPKLGSAVNIVQSRWQQAAAKTEQMWSRISRTVANSIAGMTRRIQNEMNSMISTINYGISNINYSISGIEAAMNFGPWEVPTATGSRIIGFHASFPRVPNVPYLASGAVIPPRSEFLAVLGDQKSGNNIEAPESLLRKIVREESGTAPGGGQYRFTAQLNRRTIFDEVIEEAKLRRDLNGRNPFLLT